MVVKLAHLLTSLALPALALSWGHHGPVVETEHGKVQGFNNGGLLKKATVEAFQGIPYAAPPVGENRFKPPQPFKSAWSPETRSAQKPGNICVQMGAGDEDCLYLNVYRPVGAKNGSNIPVIVYIYGGGWVMGDSLHLAAGKGALYDPTNIVERHGHVFVSMNYRLSGLGFLALPELAAESPTETTGNYGLQDQRAAMQWVQRNIAAFGGDPSKVTIQGESAGAFSVMFHLVSPGSKGLFRSAIEESGTTLQSCYFQNKTDSFKFNKEWAAIHGCNVTGAELPACLRKLPAKDFMFGTSPKQMVKDWAARLRHKDIPSDVPDWACPLFPANAWGAVIDGSNEGLPDWPLQLLSSGKFNKVPLISGANVNGGGMFAWLFPLLWGSMPYPFEPKDALKEIGEWWLRKPEDRQNFLKLYGGSDWRPQTPHQTHVWDIYRMDRFWRDSFFMCPNRETAMQFTAHDVPVYEYVFSFDMKTNISSLIGAIDATHGFELPFVFRNFLNIGSVFRDRKEWNDMADVMSCTWASFVKCQKPKCPASEAPPNCEAVSSTLPDWPAFSQKNRQYMSFKSASSIESFKNHTDFPNDEFPGDDRCDFWKNVDWGWQSIRRWPKDSGSESDFISRLEEKMLNFVADSVEAIVV